MLTSRPPSGSTTSRKSVAPATLAAFAQADSAHTRAGVSGWPALGLPAQEGRAGARQLRLLAPSRNSVCPGQARLHHERDGSGHKATARPSQRLMKRLPWAMGTAWGDFVYRLGNKDVTHSGDPLLELCCC